MRTAKKTNEIDANVQPNDKVMGVKKICPTPKEIHNILNEYVIGQEDAKKTLSVAIYNHYKRAISNVFHVSAKKEYDNVNIEKSNVLLLGNTGTGKTYMVKTIANAVGLPCYIADATRLTASGYVGDDVETVITGLLQECNYNVELAQMGIICIDESDKLARKGDNPSLTRDVGGESVQQGILKIIEGSVVGVPPQGGRKHPEQPLIYVDTTNILFIFMGAFDGLDRIIESRTNKNSIGFNKPNIKNNECVYNEVTPEDLKKYGFIPELIGRMPVITSTNDLTKDDMIRILKEPKNALIKQYQKLMSIDGIELSFTDSAIDKIVEYALDVKTGARGLRRIMEKVLSNVMYDFSDYNKNKVIIDLEYVENILQIKKAV